MRIRVLTPRLGRLLIRRLVKKNGGINATLVNVPMGGSSDKWNRQVGRIALGSRRAGVVIHRKSGVDMTPVRKVGVVTVIAVMLVCVVRVNGVALVIVIVLANEVVALVGTGR